MDRFPDFFHDLLKDPCNNLLEKELDRGKIPIGYTCSYVPEVLLTVGDLLPVRVFAPGVSGTETADIYLSNVICSYTRSLLEFAMDDRYDFLKGWVFAASCDHLRRLYDNLDYLLKPQFIHILDVPHRLGKTPLSWYTEELKTLTTAMTSHFNVDYGDKALLDAINQHNEFIRLLESVGEFRKEKYPPISGSEFHTLMIASQAAPKNLLVDKIDEFKLSLSKRKKNSDYRARLLIVGGHLDDPNYIKIIESTGGLVVADHLCTGSIPGLTPIEIKDDPLTSIADHYLSRTSCPRMMEEFDSRVASILKSASEYNVDGVIIEFVKFCDTWGIESGLLVSAIRDAGIPVISLEREYRLTGEGQLRTRIQAFIESMGK